MKKLFSLFSALYFLAATAAPSELTKDEFLSLAAGTEIQESVAVTEHSVMIQGRKVNYTAAAGALDVSTGGERREISYTAYTRGNVDDAGSRPITFVLDGGEGSAGMWLHIGLLGPRSVDLEPDGTAAQFPPALIDNAYSILDMTDLLFLDPVGAGDSATPDGDGCPDDSAYSDGIRQAGDFIRLYVSRSHRWGSPKFIAGEAYGATQAVELCEYLYDSYGMGLNGLMLIPTAGAYPEFSFDAGNWLPYALYLPTYAAEAWYHGLLDRRYQNMELEDFLDEVRGFAGGEYVSALFQGRSLSAEEMENMAEQIAAYTGLEEDFVLKSRLRIDPDSFCREKAMSRADGRFSAPAASGLSADGAASTGMDDIVFSAGANLYFSDELDAPDSSAYHADGGWASAGGFSAFAQAERIQECMSRNSFLKVWLISSIFDNTMPFYGAEWLYNQIVPAEAVQDNLSVSSYPAGHRFYLDGDALALFRSEAEAWFN